MFWLFFLQKSSFACLFRLAVSWSIRFCLSISSFVTKTKSLGKLRPVYQPIAVPIPPNILLLINTVFKNDLSDVIFGNFLIKSIGSNILLEEINFSPDGVSRAAKTNPAKAPIVPKVFLNPSFEPISMHATSA